MISFVLSATVVVTAWAFELLTKEWLKPQIEEWFSVIIRL